ncbi:alkanesulfonate monooxygenase SsuD/methylene tetrahydromethanopterin reductase-like flavin-dependent oxidoreductase (luciferase family) [Brevibacterium sanguinis]|uniref:Alkanesulfonate monooxygenase SsuD/methylene tetrahydromethanopterin reductase-like flavin-dependent oxidoreductase (Luciferase family) n=2 Tax=Brevibacterium TaxID=1696 RepID=A0A366II50_9MICO|nr:MULTISPECIES: LLM class flavin-dependent oxidoreductase [Brevibacterium]RBP64176.1 alkanesulfonate monooxygenase SsuD/methylene tetrahydromethanopterin reductase-like flavin-dependent oxidoreductase (luciferase family) [Brevibacterium sanguinis]RBP71532.1 alkanesulfonate monooxygenase SsuD/methylene tetrahydromethanopterin reductase-like flavin-dependent oxidoreductase (luciferase family) [Brevibacterium celere]
MKAFGFLSFGHYGTGPISGDFGAREALQQAVEIGVGADEIGVNGAYFRVHHFAKQAAAPIPLLSAIAARTRHIEVGTGVIDMRYENPLHLAEEAAALDLLSDGRVALGISRGSPEPALRGWEAFGYEDTVDGKGAEIARTKFARFLSAIRGREMVDADPAQFGPGVRLPIEPRSAGLDRRIWWGAGSRATAEWAAEQGVNLMSSTLLTEATGVTFGELQREQIDRYRQAWAAAGHGWTPRVSVSRSVFPITTDLDDLYFGRRSGADSDQIGIIDGLRSTFGRTYAAEPDRLIDELRADPAIEAADTLMLTVPNQLGVDYNLHILESFAEHVAPALGWKPGPEGPVEGYALDH